MSSGLVFVLYDHVITLNREVQLFWFPEKFSVACILFFVNRYWVLVTAILQLSPYGGFYSDNVSNFISCYIRMDRTNVESRFDRGICLAWALLISMANYASQL